MAITLDALGFRPEDLRRAKDQRLRELEQARQRQAAEQVIDILWGWDQIAEALGIGVKKARELFKHEDLPVWSGKGDAVQSTRAALQAWATSRAVESSEYLQNMQPFISKNTPD